MTQDFYEATYAKLRDGWGVRIDSRLPRGVTANVRITTRKGDVIWNVVRIVWTGDDRSLGVFLDKDEIQDLFGHKPMMPADELMTSERAREVLGLSSEHSDADVRTAYRRLQQQLHPDKGGSAYLSMLVNMAADELRGAA